MLRSTIRHVTRSRKILLGSAVGVLFAAGIPVLVSFGLADAAAVSFTTTLVNQGSGQCAEVPGGAATSALQLAQNPCNEGAAQRLTFTPLSGSTDTYTVGTLTAGSCVDVYGRSTADGAQIIQYACHSQTNQQFRLRPVGAGATAGATANAFNVVAVHSGKCVAVAGDAGTAGAKLVQSTCTSAASGVWALPGYPGGSSASPSATASATAGPSPSGTGPSASPTGPSSQEPASTCALTGNGGDSHVTNWSRHVNPVGTRRAVMIFVDFPNAPASSAPSGYTGTSGYVSFLVPGAQQWFATSSYGRFDLQVTPVDKWYRMGQNDSAYGFSRGISYATHVAYISEAVRLADPDVDFSGYDMVYIVPARNASGISFSPTFVGGSSSSISADGKRIGAAVTFGQDMWSWGYKVVNHETGHIVGLPDLYAFTAVNGDAHPYVAGWDLMGLISGKGPDYVGWHKWKNGWLDDNQIDCVSKAGTTTHTITPIEQPGGVKLLLVRTGTSTLYGVENRQAVLNDSTTCSTGTLIYKIDTSVATGAGPIRVVDATPGGGTRSGCRDLDIATFAAGTSFTDPATGVAIQVTGVSGQNQVVTVTKS